MKSISRPDELPNLDALRSIAVLLVLFDHVLEAIAHKTGNSFAPYDWYLGRLGVLLFFVHTSYVLMASLERLGYSGWPLMRTFYIRRAFRLYPLALVCVLAVVVIRVPPLPWELVQVPRPGDLVANFLLVMNITKSPPVLSPLWSLPVELQMYLVLPLIFMATRRVTNLNNIGWIYVFALACACGLPWLSWRLGDAVFLPCFMAGILAYGLKQKIVPVISAIWWPVFLIALVALYVVAEDATVGIHHTWLQAAICLLAGLAIPLFRQSSMGSLNLVAHLVAKYSYSIYLFHCVSLWIALYAVPVGGLLIQFLIALAIQAVISVVCYHWIESPAISIGAQLSKRRATVILPNHQSS